MFLINHKKREVFMKNDKDLEFNKKNKSLFEALKKKGYGKERNESFEEKIGESSFKTDIRKSVRSERIQN